MTAQLPVGEPSPIDGSLPAGALMNLADQPLGFYVHVPFCATRCGYCDFNTYTAAELGGGGAQRQYADVVMAELRLARQVLGDQAPPVSTIFFGGGTPTLLPASHLTAVLTEIHQLFNVLPNAEISTEANPETLTAAYLSRLREGGFNRLSLGMQSVQPHVLAVLDRQHTVGKAIEAVLDARQAGFQQINLDLIYGTPGESDTDWQSTLDTAIGARPDHISAYALIVESGTRLAAKINRGDISAPADDVLADRYLQTEQTLAAAGFGWYEISNWSRNSGSRCQHNEIYWSGGNWWGIGPGAHSHVGGVRWWNVKHPSAYATKLHAGQSPAHGREQLTQRERDVERIMLGIRMREGIELAMLSRAGREAASRAVTYELIDRDAYRAGRAILTLRGRLLADAVVRDLMD